MEKVVAFKLTDKEYAELEERAKQQGYSNVAEYVKNTILSMLQKKEEPGEIETTMYSRLQRRIQDLINPFTAKVDEALRRAADLQSRIEALEARISDIEGQLRVRARKPAKPTKRKSAVERLREQGVVYEEDVGWLRNKDAFFDKLEREGAIVKRLPSGRIAIDPDFWKKFVSRVQRIRLKKEDEILAKGVLDPAEYMLFVKLKASGLIYYDGAKKAWRVVEEAQD